MNCSYDVQYLGGAMLTKPATTTGLGVLQQPLIDMYVTYFQPKSATPRPLPSRRITLTDRGMIVSALDADQPEDQDAFFAMPSIIFWEAVRFVAVRISDKKYRGAFEPVGDAQLTKENLYTEIDKRNLHLATQVKQHPVLLVCVLRRTTGIRSLDLHAFVCNSPRLAVSIAETLSIAQENFSQQSNASDTFSYDPFDKGNVRQAVQGLQIIDTVSPAAAARLLDDMRRQPATVTAASVNRDAQRRTRDDVRKQPSRNDQSMFAASNASNMDQCGFMLTQEDIFASNLGLNVDDGHNSAAARNQAASGRAVGRSQTVYIPQRDVDRPTTTPSTWLDDGPSPQRGAAQAAGGGVTRSKTVSQPRGDQSRPNIPQMPAYDQNAAARSRMSVMLPQQQQQQQQQQLQQQQMALYDVPNPNPVRVDRRMMASDDFQSQQQLAAPGFAGMQGQRGPAGNRNPTQPDRVPDDAPPYFDFHFGFDPSSAGGGGGGPAESRPVALVQPRKIQGIRVLPGEINLPSKPLNSTPPIKQQQQQQYSSNSASSTAALKVELKPISPPQQQQQQQQEPPSPAESRLLPPSIVVDAPSTRSSSKDQQQASSSSSSSARQPVGTLREHLKNMNAAKQPSASDMAARMRDHNSNFKLTPDPTPTSSAQAQQQQQQPQREKELPLQQLFKNGGGSASSSLSPGSAGNSGNGRVSPAVNRARNYTDPLPTEEPSEPAETKDREIASTVGDMRLDYRNESNTLSARGTNFEKCLGYFP